MTAAIKRNRDIRLVKAPQELRPFYFLMAWHPRLESDPPHVWLPGGDAIDNCGSQVAATHTRAKLAEYQTLSAREVHSESGAGYAGWMVASLDRKRLGHAVRVHRTNTLHLRLHDFALA